MLKLKNSFKKLWIILLSRNKKPNQEQWELDRKKECDKCPFNTKNMEIISSKQKVYNFLSNILTLIMTGKPNKTNHSCSACGCTLEFKIPEPTEKCDKNKWKY